MFFCHHGAFDPRSLTYLYGWATNTIGWSGVVFTLATILFIVAVATILDTREYAQRDYLRRLVLRQKLYIPCMNHGMDWAMGVDCGPTRPAETPGP